MTRILSLQSTPYSDFLNNRQENQKIIVPNTQAANALDVPYLSLEGLATRLLHRNGLGVASALTAYHLFRETVSESTAATDVPSRARYLLPLVRDLLGSGTPLETFEAFPTERVREAAQIATRYRHRLREQSLVEEAELLGEASRYVTQRQNLLVYGYPSLNRHEQHVIDALADEGSRVILPYAAHKYFGENRHTASAFEQNGWLIQHEDTPRSTLGDRLVAAFLQAGDLPNRVHATVYPNQETEARGVLGQIKTWMASGISPAEIAIVTGDEGLYGPMLHAMAWEYQVPVRTRYALPLRDTRIGSWLRLLTTVIQEKFPFEATLRCLMHPLGPGLSEDALFLAYKYRPNGLRGWHEIGLDLSPFDWPSQGSWSDWVNGLHTLFQTFSTQRKLAYWAQDVLAFDALQEALGIMAAWGTSVVRRESFLAELEDILALFRVPSQPGMGGVEVYSPRAIYGARFRHVCVVGMAEKILPAPIAVNAHLSEDERQQLKALGVDMPDAAIESRREALSFCALLQTVTENLVLSYPKLIDNREKLESAYFSALALVPSKPPELPPMSLQELRQQQLLDSVMAGDPDIPDILAGWGVERRREAPVPPDEYDGMISLPISVEERTFSPTELLTLGKCAFSWFSRYPLQLSEAEENTGELSTRLRGQLYHKVAELLLERLQKHINGRDTLMEHLTGAFHRAEQKLELYRVPAWSVQRLEHLRTLKKVLASEAILPPDTDIVKLEEKFSGVWHGLQVKGQVDRIDRTPKGLVVMDYKTSSQRPDGVKDEAGRLKVDIQLPIYAQVAIPAIFPNEVCAEACYFSLTKGKVLPKPREDTSNQLEGFVESVKTRLQTGAFPVNPDSEQKACGYCDFDLLCRRGPRLRQKGGVS